MTDIKFKDWQSLQEHCPAHLGGWTTRVDREWLFQTVQALPAEAVIVEVGVYLGPNLAHMALVSKMQDAARRIHGVDNWIGDSMWSGDRMRDACRANVDRTGAGALVTLHTGDSATVGHVWVTPADLLIVDGDHSYEGELADLKAWCPHVKPGCLAVVDDCNATQVMQACRDYFDPAQWAQEKAPRDTFPDLQGGANGPSPSGYEVWRRRPA